MVCLGACCQKGRFKILPLTAFMQIMGKKLLLSSFIQILHPIDCKNWKCMNSMTSQGRNNNLGKKIAIDLRKIFPLVAEI